MSRFRSAAVLFCTVLIGTALTGCAARSAVADPQQRWADPQHALAASLAGVTAGRYSFDITFPEAHLAGSIDKVDHQAHWTSTMDDQPGRIITQDLVIGDDMYVANSGGGRGRRRQTPAHRPRLGALRPGT